MKPMTKGLLLAALHLAIVCSLGGKLLYDRATRPRVWVQVANFDPDLPIRGRYLSLNVVVPAEKIRMERSETGRTNTDATPVYWYHPQPSQCDLVLRNGVLVAVGNPDGEFDLAFSQQQDTNKVTVASRTPFFLPEHADDPSRPRGREMWMEATIPRKGPPRPIRLGVKTNDTIVPLPLN